MLYSGFNQDNGCFAVGENTGFRVFTTSPFNEQFRRQFEGQEAGIGIVEMLFRCNIFALVGGGPHPRFPCNKVMIWDDHQGRCIGELTFRNQVRAVKLRRDRIAVALDHRVLIYNFADLRLIYQWETIYNGKGLLAVSSQVDNTVVACPGVHVGQVRVELMDRRDFRLIDAHNTPVAAIALSLNGSRLATASEKGTLIRVFDTSSGQKLQELRRGTDPAEIYHIAFDRSCAWLAVTSDKNTVHIFALRETSERDISGAPAPGRLGDADRRNPGTGPGQVTSPTSAGEAKNKGSWLNIAQGLIPLPAYFSSEWSFAQFRLTEPGKAYIGFQGDEDRLFVVTENGGFFRLKWNCQEGGTMEQELFQKFDDQGALPDS